MHVCVHMCVCDCVLVCVHMCAYGVCVCVCVCVCVHSHLQPPSDSALSSAVLSLAGCPETLCSKAIEAAAAGDAALATSLIQFAWNACPGNAVVVATRKKLLEDRAAGETSLMSRNIYSAAARDCAAVLEKAKL